MQTLGVDVFFVATFIVKWSKNMDTWAEKGSKGGKVLKDLGVNFADVKAGNTQEVLLQVADAMAKIENPAKRAAAAQALFGRQGQKLLPILMSGRKGIQDQLDTAKKYGAVVGEDQVNATKKMVSAQRELALAHKGVQVAIGSALLPAQAELYGSLLQIVQTVLPFVDNVNVMKGALIAAAVGMGILKVATIASTVAQLGLDAAMLPVIGIIAAIVVGIAALIAIGYLLYKNWDSIAALAGTVWATIESAAASVLDWFKSNWPLLLGILTGPFGLAIALIVTHWNAIKSAITSALTAIRTAVTTAWNAVLAIIRTVGAAITAAVRLVWTTITSVTTAGVNAIRNAVVAGFNAVVAAVRTAITAMVGAITGGVGRARAAATSIANAVKGVFAGASGWLVAAGRAIVTGLVHGIESAAGAAVSAAEHLASRIKGAFAGALSIFSPSRVFMEYGRQTAAGYALGLTRAAGLVDRAVSSLVPGAPGALAAPALALPAGAVEVNVYIGDQELRGIVRTEIVTDNSRVARRLLAGNR
jgi:hypothetical protein